jgi:1-aminocyclopropane-1-carboxylate deaminase
MTNLQLLTHHTPSPIQEVTLPELEGRGVRWLVKRDDLLAPPEAPNFCGNKWRKMKYNLLEADKQGCTRLITMGGAFSNHIAAVAAAGMLFGVDTVGYIRGEAAYPLNPTLQGAIDMGMELRFVSREDYRKLREKGIPPELPGDYPIPEGGTNPMAMPGCRELGEELLLQLDDPGHSTVVVACGTGGTLAGLITGLQGLPCLGIPVLKGDFMTTTVQGYHELFTGRQWPHWQTIDGFHFGGYAKTTPVLLSFITNFYTQTGIPLDKIYTGKMFFAIFQLIQSGFFFPGSTVLSIHSGGLQGN